MKKKFLNLIFAICLIIPTIFMFSACEKDKTITDISIVDMPKYIVEGRFTPVKIEAKLTYDDNSTEKFYLTEDMLSNEDKAKVQTLGDHEITINYKGETEVIEIKVVSKSQLLENLMYDLIEMDFSFVANIIENDIQIGTGEMYNDGDNNVCKILQTDDADYYFEEYIWKNGDYCYSANNKVLDAQYSNPIYRYPISTFKDMILEYLYFEPEMLNNSNAQFSVDKDNNYVFTVEDSFNEGKSISTTNFIFNIRGIVSISSIYTAETFTNSINIALNIDDAIELTVPQEFKVLEDSAIDAY